VALEFRIFNDGVAYRYRVPGTGTRRIDSEVSQWKIPSGSTLWYQNAENKSYESPYESAAIERLAAGITVAAPMTVTLPDGWGYAMLTEANLVNYSDMSLASTAPNSFQARFTNDPQGWTNNGEIVSPGV